MTCAHWRHAHYAIGIVAEHDGINSPFDPFAIGLDHFHVNALWGLHGHDQTKAVISPEVPFHSASL